MGKIDRRAPFHSHTVLKTVVAVAKGTFGFKAGFCSVAIY